MMRPVPDAAKTIFSMSDGERALPSETVSHGSLSAVSEVMESMSVRRPIVRVLVCSVHAQ